MSLHTVLRALGAAALLTGALGACNDANRITNDCPTKDALVSGAACTMRDLQCPFDTTQTACDGTVTTISTSCVCTANPGAPSTWSCPAPWVCDAGGARDDGAASGEGGGDDGSSGDDGAGDTATGDDGGADVTDAPGDAIDSGPTDAPHG